MDFYSEAMDAIIYSPSFIKQVVIIIHYYYELYSSGIGCTNNYAKYSN